MPFPESKYPSVIRGMTATQSFRLMNAAPRLLSMLKDCVEFYGSHAQFNEDPAAVDVHDRIMLNAIAAIYEAEGTGDDPR